MTIRTTTRTVAFRRPFTLSGLDRVQPAGTYTVETDKELLDTMSISAYRRIVPLTRLHPYPANPRIFETVSVDPEELDAAVVRDASPNLLIRRRISCQRQYRGHGLQSRGRQERAKGGLTPYDFWKTARSTRQGRLPPRQRTRRESQFWRRRALPD